MLLRLLFITVFAATAAFSQTPAVPPIEPGVSHDLAKWRAARYSDVRYKLNLTLEKMSPVLKGTMEIRVKVSEPPASAGGQSLAVDVPPVVLDWRKIRGSEALSSISNVSVNGKAVSLSSNWPPANAGGSDFDEHLIFRDGVAIGENVIKLDFTSPILTSGSAITRYIDKEDGSEYIYSLFVPSDASTAFPVFDQPDLKARFTLDVTAPGDWAVVSNGIPWAMDPLTDAQRAEHRSIPKIFDETKPISTYVFAFAAGPFERVSEPPALAGGQKATPDPTNWPAANAAGSDKTPTSIYVRKSQASKFQPHAAEVFRLNREGVKFLESYFDYKFPFPKYDIVLIPEFPFGGMEHAGATFLRESSVIFPQEPTKNDYISRANVIFHEAAHQWFGDTVTMKWFDDLWLKEGFAEFMAYKTLEAVQGGNPIGSEGVVSTKDTGQMPQVNAWKVFYERNKQAAYLTDSTKGTTPIYQEIANLNSAKSAYGNIVYRKAPSFLRQAEFYLGPDKFQTAVRAFLKKHEYANAGWEDLVKEFEAASGKDLKEWASVWVKQKGFSKVELSRTVIEPTLETGKRAYTSYGLTVFTSIYDPNGCGDWRTKIKVLYSFPDGTNETDVVDLPKPIDCESYHVLPTMRSLEGMLYDEKDGKVEKVENRRTPNFVFPNYQDYGYGIFLLDDKSRDYVLKNIQNEKDDFLRSMMWGSLWDSVREAELDPQEYVELVIKNLSTEQDETTVAALLNRVGTAISYYMSEPPALAGGQKATPVSTNWPAANAAGSALETRLEALLIDRIQNAPTAGQRITFYRALVSNATTERSRDYLKRLLKSEPPAVAGGSSSNTTNSTQSNASKPTGDMTLRTKDRFDIVTRLIILGDPDAPALLDELVRSNNTDEAKRYAYAARAAIPTKENREKFWNDFTNNKEISESWIEAAAGPFNSIRHDELSLPYLERALKELPNLKRTRKIFFINNWLAAFVAGQRSEQALAIINKFLADNPNLDKDLRLKILENSDLIERALKIRKRFSHE